MSNFSFSHNVFNNCLLLMRQNEYLWSKGLKMLYLTTTDTMQFLQCSRRVKIMNAGYEFEHICLQKLDPWLNQYSFRGLMIVIATGLMPFSLLSIVLTMVIWESSQWLGNNIVWSKAWTDHYDITEILLKRALNTIQSIKHVKTR